MSLLFNKKLFYGNLLYCVTDIIIYNFQVCDAVSVEWITKSSKGIINTNGMYLIDFNHDDRMVRTVEIKILINQP